MGTDIPLLAIRKQIASAIDIIIQLERLRDKSRRVTEITEVIGCENGEICLNPLFIFEEKKVEGRSDRVSEAANYMAGTAEVEGRLVPTGHSLVRRKKLEAAALALGAGL